MGSHHHHLPMYFHIVEWEIIIRQFSWFLSLDKNCRQHQETSANWINIYLTCYMNPHIFITDLASMARSRYVIFFYMHISCLSPLNKVTFNWFWVAWARLHFPFAFPFKRLPRRLNFQKNISWQYQNEVAFSRLVSKGTSNGHWRKGMRSADSMLLDLRGYLKATRKVAVLNDSLYLSFRIHY